MKIVFAFLGVLIEEKMKCKTMIKCRRVGGKTMKCKEFVNNVEDWDEKQKERLDIPSRKRGSIFHNNRQNPFKFLAPKNYILPKLAEFLCKNKVKRARGKQMKVLFKKMKIIIENIGIF